MGSSGIGSSSGGDKTPVKKKGTIGSTTASGSGIKKGEQNSFSSTTKSISSGSGSVIGGAGASGSSGIG